MEAILRQIYDDEVVDKKDQDFLAYFANPDDLDAVYAIIHFLLFEYNRPLYEDLARYLVEKYDYPSKLIYIYFESKYESCGPFSWSKTPEEVEYLHIFVTKGDYPNPEVVEEYRKALDEWLKFKEIQEDALYDSFFD